MRSLIVLALSALIPACDGSSTPAKPAKPACDLSVATLTGKTFVMLENTGNGEVRNPQARLKFVSEGGGLKAKYTVKSLDRVYDYECEDMSSDKRQEVKCMAEPNLAAMCIALEVNKAGSCSKAAIGALGVKATAEEFDKAIKEGKEAVAKAKPAPSWPQFKIMYNNVGNTLQGVLYAKVDAQRCRLSVDDMFMTVHDGKKKEDFNPVGTNPFVLTDKTFLFDDCPVPRVLAGWKEPKLPEDLSKVSPVGEFEAGKDVHYIYVGDKETKATEGCTYTADTWVNWEAADKGVAIKTEGDAIDWHTVAKHGAGSLTVAAGKKGIVYHMTRHKECAGKKETIDTVCAAAIIK